MRDRNNRVLWRIDKKMLFSSKTKDFIFYFSFPENGILLFTLRACNNNNPPPPAHLLFSTITPHPPLTPQLSRRLLYSLKIFKTWNKGIYFILCTFCWIVCVRLVKRLFDSLAFSHIVKWASKPCSGPGADSLQRPRGSQSAANFIFFSPSFAKFLKTFWLFFF